MKINEICNILDARWLNSPADHKGGENIEIVACHASDLMSDVLTVCGQNSLLLTGLTNAQVVRVAEVADIVAVCFVRGKMPQANVIQLAREREIPLLITSLSMYESCGHLYAKGLPGGIRSKDKPI
jgi:hypothetical protein